MARRVHMSAQEVREGHWLQELGAEQDRTGVVRNRNKLPIKFKASTVGSVLGIAYPERPPASLLGDPHRRSTLSWSFSSFYRTVSPLRGFLHCLT